MRYFITGASGFVGGELVNRLNSEGLSWLGISRSKTTNPNIHICELSNKLRLIELLKGVDCIVHCAGYAHAFKLPPNEILNEAWAVNVCGTEVLLEAAAESGVKKFIFLSSVKAMSESGEICVDESWDCLPASKYGQSKLAAEQLIEKYADLYKLEYVILRLTMVYGGGKGNLERMARLVKKRCFPPIPDTGNHRSMIYIEDLLDIIVIAMKKTQMIANDIYIVTGPAAPSGRQLYDGLRSALSMSATSVQVPKISLVFFALIFDYMQIFFKKQLPFNSEVLDRLIHSAWYSSKKIENATGWRPKVTLEQGLRALANRTLSN
ncbi:NAD-dependent epimerase/dehydratase family protein [Polynucleobacter nymphae]|uniref:NAD-dependent epimerase/dehydratase family protein n=1 Tax=Polynucleobacter nymphae TaxID=2081043 RepID=UPI001C0D4946|nr:NAD-dependent epimerase/dehydratase family protein [Polynucleobacter nymphae]MBU3607771.1 NAD-dependent epimerase/dehydratase family protein [Polynucleobacter nymphae]